ncbi:MAG TPA: response regulator [Bacteroidales bacterium]|nr:response regulator [Bacteroidales bacterium]
MQLEGKKILIVEDDFSSRLYLNKLFEKTGAILYNAVDGREAFDLAINNTDIELILMDIQIPGIDGYTCTKMLREAGRDVIIIAQTAYGLTGDKEKMMSSGFNDYLIKPISGNALLEKLALYLK